MTSNLGSREIQAAEGDEKQVREAVLEELRLNFKPEFLNRIDDIVIFHQLSQKEIAQIIDVQLDRLRQMLKDRNITISLDESARGLLAREGYDPSLWSAAVEARHSDSDSESAGSEDPARGDPAGTGRESVSRWRQHDFQYRGSQGSGVEGEIEVSKQWNPLQDLMLLQDRMNRLFEDATERRTRVDAETE